MFCLTTRSNNTRFHHPGRWRSNLFVLAICTFGNLWMRTVAPLAAASAVSSKNESVATQSPLTKARSLTLPDTTAMVGGETENLEFWDTHENVLKQAWGEWSQLEEVRAKLPDITEDTDIIMLNPALVHAVDALWQDPTIAKEDSLQRTLWEEQIPGVWVCPNFLTEQGIRRLRKHLQEASQAGIPTRRPNGMNRYGLVLDTDTQGGVTYGAVNTFRDHLVNRYIRPLGRLFFKDYIGSGDDASSYAFTIHYDAAAAVSHSSTDTSANAVNGDVQLKEHSDASVVTLNLNLNVLEEDYEGGVLEFLDDDTGQHHPLQMSSGMAVLHRGLHRHRVLPIQHGQRHQLVVWLFGEYSYVRVAPYEAHEKLIVKERWSTLSSTKEASQQLQECDLGTMYDRRQAPSNCSIAFAD